MHALLTQIVLLGDQVESLIGSKFFFLPRGPRKGLQRSACVCIQEILMIIAEEGGGGGSDRAVCFSRTYYLD